MALTKEQQQIIESIELEEELETSLDLFIKQGGDEVAPYFTSEVGYQNGRTITVWGIENLPYNVRSLTSPSAFDIAFNACKSSLARDPKWMSAKAIYKELEPRLTAAQFRAVCTGQEIALSGEVAQLLLNLGGAEVFREFADGKRS